MDFWQNLQKPVLALAPMAGVTDSAFRLVCREQGADVVYSEMASATALAYGQEKKTLELLRFCQAERPYVVQLFGSEPEYFARAARIVTQKIQPDGIDINFGCPVPKVAKQKAGAELMKDPDRSRRVVQAVLDNTDLPISVKTRIRSGEVTLNDFLEAVVDLPVSALMVHARTLGQGFAGDPDFTPLHQGRERFGGILLANGGITDVLSGAQALQASAADGLGLARGAMGNPWLFRELRAKFTPGVPEPAKRDRQELVATVYRQAELSYDLKGEAGIREMRKHLCWYLRGLAGAAELRKQAVQVSSLSDIWELLQNTRQM